MRAFVAAIGLMALGCLPPGQDSAPAAARQALTGELVYHLTNANVVELRSTDLEVTQRVEGGNLVLSLCLRHNSLYNLALGIDHLYYDAPAPPFGVLSANEPGWIFNCDGTVADGFGSFASHKSINSAGRGGTSCEAPLVFTLAGDPTLGANTPLQIAVHLRYEGDCSGWISNRTAGTAYADVNCRRLPDCPPQPPYCFPPQR